VILKGKLRGTGSGNLTRTGTGARQCRPAGGMTLISGIISLRTVTSRLGRLIQLAGRQPPSESYKNFRTLNPSHSLQRRHKSEASRYP
jgi:hypothetical protein